MTGRQVSWMIYDHYSRQVCTITMYGCEYMGKITWLGDDIQQLRKFLEICAWCCDNIENEETTSTDLAQTEHDIAPTEAPTQH